MKGLKVRKPDLTERDVEGSNITGRKVELKVFPVRNDTSYIVVKSSEESGVIDTLYPKFEHYLEQRGFKKEINENSNSVRFVTDYGFDIYFGKLNRNHRHKAFKFQSRGEYLIYKKAERIVRDIISDFKKIAATHKEDVEGDKMDGVLLNVSHSRVDPSMLIIADDWRDILPEPEDNILNASTMKPSYIWSRTTKEATGIIYSNSKFRIKVYDKETELLDNKKKHSGDYIRHYMKYVKQAKKLGKRLYRLELMNLHEPHLFEYDNVFMSADFSEENLRKALEKMLSDFSAFHAFKQVPENQANKLDKRNISKWEQDPISGILLFDRRMKDVEVENLKEESEEDFKYITHKPKKLRDFDEIEKAYVRALLNIDVNLSKEQLRFFFREAEKRYYDEKSLKSKDLRENIINQSKFRLSIAETSEEIDLILKERDVLLKKINVNDHAGFKSYMTKLANQAKERLRQKGFLNPQQLSLVPDPV